jgi:hypothetical protein
MDMDKVVPTLPLLAFAALGVTICSLQPSPHSKHNAPTVKIASQRHEAVTRKSPTQDHQEKSRQ